ncbi:MAG: hypothetical protein FK733_16350 [Asgard group archaeon]|nr:hypothetical protein [Asgard group archaeon]
MSNDQIIENDYEENDYVEKEKKFHLGDTGRKILTYAIIIIVSFSLGCAIVGFSMRSSENSARKDLANGTNFITTIITGFNVEIYNSSSEEFSDYAYVYISNTSTFEDTGGVVDYNDAQEDREYMTIYYPLAVSDLSITEIAFSIGEKSQLNIIIFADGREVYNALRIRNDIILDLDIPAIEIVVYVF